MDSLSMRKIQAINKYKKQQLLTNIILYTVTAMSCSLFCSSPFWYPPLCATFNVFLYVSLPKLFTLFSSSKVVFIVGNLIVIFLLGEFKILAVPNSSEAHDEGGRGQNQVLQSFNKKKGKSERAEKKGKSTFNYHKIAEVTTQMKVISCESENAETSFAGAYNYQTNSVTVNRKRPIKVSVRLEETSPFTEGSQIEERIDDLEKKSDGEELKSNVKDLNKMADDFIERVNRQRRLEAELYSIKD